VLYIHTRAMYMPSAQSEAKQDLLQNARFRIRTRTCYAFLVQQGIFLKKM